MYKVFVKDIPIILSTQKKIDANYHSIPLEQVRIKKIIKSLYSGKVAHINIYHKNPEKLEYLLRKKLKSVEAAGGVVYNENGDVLFIRRNKKWDLPKGKIEKGESFELVHNGVEKRERTIFPSPIRDIGAAMLLLRENADNWLIDTDRIALCGFSAGAHNVATYSVYWNHEIVTGHFNVSPEALRPATIISGYMLSDYLYMRDIEKNESDEALFRASAMSLLGTETPDDEALYKVSPARLVNEHTPPMFLWSTSEDSLVPVGHTTRMATALADKGIPFEVHIFEEGPHGLSLSTQATANNHDLINADAAQWIDLAERWLLKRFAMEIK